MKRASSSQRQLPPTLAIAGVAAVLLAACFLLSRTGLLSPKPTRVWKGYYTIAVRVAPSDAARFSALLARLGPGVVSEQTATASFCDFEGERRCPYAELDSRLDPRDPRRDPWLDRMGLYFRLIRGDGEWRLAYAPARGTGLSLFLRTAGALGLPWDGQWRIVEFDPLEKLVCLCVLLGCASLLALSRKEDRRLAFILALCDAALWIPFVLSGGIAELSLSLILFLAWFPLMRAWTPHARERSSRSRKDLASRNLRELLGSYGIIAVIGAALLLATRGWTAWRLVSCILTVAASLALLESLFPIVALEKSGRRRRAGAENARSGSEHAHPASERKAAPSKGPHAAPARKDTLKKQARGDAGKGKTASKRTRASSKRGRTVFEPVPIVHTHSDPFCLPPMAFFAVPLLLLLVMVLPLIRGMTLPAPLRTAGVRDFSWQSLARMPSNGRIDHLPDYADLVAHEAYQQSLLFGRQRGLPTRNERVYTRVYSIDPHSGRIVAGRKTVKTFDSQWLGSVSRGAGPGSLETLLITQGSPSVVGLRGPTQWLVRELPFLLLALFALLLQGAAAVFGLDPGPRPLIRGDFSRLNSMARRKQIP